MAMKSSFKNMTICLLAICLVCSSLLAVVFAVTKEPIALAEKTKNVEAIKAVLPYGATTFDEEKTFSFEGKDYKYVVARNDNGDFVGCAIDVAPVGFGGPIKIKVGFNAEGVIWNTKVLSQAETPGLGAKCVEPAFAEQFQQFNPAEKILKVQKDKGDVNAITASTITSRAYADGLATAVSVFQAIGQTPMPLVEDVIPSEEPSVIPSEVEESNIMEE